MFCKRHNYQITGFTPLTVIYINTIFILSIVEILFKAFDFKAAKWCEETSKRH